MKPKVGYTFLVPKLYKSLLSVKCPSQLATGAGQRSFPLSATSSLPRTSRRTNQFARWLWNGFLNKTRHESLATIRSDQDKREVEKVYGQNFGNKFATLPDLLLGKVSDRESDNEITLFHKGVGLGIEFAGAAKVVYDQARTLGMGKEIPTEWFTQTSHPSL